MADTLSEEDRKVLYELRALKQVCDQLYDRTSRSCTDIVKKSETRDTCSGHGRRWASVRVAKPSCSCFYGVDAFDRVCARSGRSWNVSQPPETAKVRAVFGCAFASNAATPVKLYCSTVFCATLLTLRLYSFRLVLYMWAASGFAGLAGFGSVSND